MTDLLPLKEFIVEIPSTTAEAGKVELKQMLPETEYSQVQTRVSVPDGGTLLLGGQKITAEIEMETATPVLGKLPLIGRLFRNRAMVKDQKVLLILVRPTIILEEEADAKALAPLESEF
jgi:type II secretory pathway component GspD/PulD (secretin)